MGTYAVQISRSAAKQIQDIPLPWRDRIGRAIDLLELNPFIGTKMRGEYEGWWKLKVWPYRIYYSMFKQEKTVIIVRVKHRGSAGYK
jgi:mRNA-degrading endonuclease RelE of RelBE toxin-antitoxin system